MYNHDGRWLRDWRLSHDYSQDELASELEVRRRTIVKWEKLPRIDRLVVLALYALGYDENLQEIKGRSGKLNRRS
jgi:DNA-binding XRE family transcriptional regulator